jgi:hypothetical protein
MPDCTPSAYWLPILSYVLPPAGALLSAIALWVASQARSTSADAQSTSQAAVSLSLLRPEQPAPSGWTVAAPDRRKSSTRGTTSTSRGEPR